jgi:RNA polymerase sigma factor (sigma-70 family)
MSERERSTIEHVIDYNGWLRAFVHKWTGNSDDTDDILQDVYLQFLKIEEGGADPIRNMSGWLYRMARNMLINRGKKRQEVLIPAIDQAEALSDSEPEEELLQAMVWDELEAALRTLPPEQRMAFELTELEGMSSKEAAAVMETSVNTLLSRKHYAVVHLRERLHDLYQDLTLD